MLQRLSVTFPEIAAAAKMNDTKAFTRALCKGIATYVGWYPSKSDLFSGPKR